VPDAVIVIYESGIGNLPDTALKTDNHLAILDISDNLVESLAEAD
jgi:hypothetical protein